MLFRGRAVIDRNRPEFVPRSVARKDEQHG
jgi:hypothetical protein